MANKLNELFSTFVSGQNLEGEAMIQAAYANLLGVANPSQARVDYWVRQISELELNKDNFAEEFLKQAAKATPAQLAGWGTSSEERAAVVKAANDSVESANSLTDIKTAVDAAVEPGNGGGEEPGTPGVTKMLTAGTDNVTGTADNDTIYANVVNNDLGILVNQLSTGDVIDGGAGNDTIQASLINDSRWNSGIDPRPTTKNVENVHIEALEDVTLDAGRMEGVKQFWADNSRSDLTISDIRLANTAGHSITKDVTFGLKDVDVDTDLSAFFESNSLKNAGTSQSNSQLVIRIADVSTETPATPLANVNMNLSFVLGGTSYELTDLRSTDGSYAGLVEAVNTKLEEIGLGRVEASLTDAYNSVTFAGNTVNLPFTANVVMLTDPEGAEFGDVNFTQNAIAPVTGGFLVAGNAEPFDPAVSTALIESNLILDNAGRGSLAGDVVIGGMSASNKFVQKLNLSVDNSSKVNWMSSANNGAASAVNRAFQEIEVTSGAAKGNLEIGNFGGDGGSFGGAGVTYANSGIGNAQVFNASNFEGTSLKVAGQAASNTAYSYTTGSSNDVINVEVNTENSASSKFTLSINTGSGNDLVNVVANGAATATQWANHSKLQNITINTGAGNDVVNATGYGAANINTGEGNDLIFTDNTGSKAKWVVNGDYGVGASTSVVGNGNVAYNMIKTKVQVDFLGLKSGYVLIDSNANHQTTARAINDAIKSAIANDETLSKLLKVTDARNDAIEIETTFGRALTATDLSISFLAPKSTGTANPTAAELLAGWDNRATVSDSELKEAWEAWSNSSLAGNSTVSDLAGTAQGATTEAQVLTYINTITGQLNTGANSYEQNNKTLGTNDSADTQNVVNAGSGHDVIVLSSNTGSGFDTVKFEAGFGHNVIVNFNTDTVAAGTTSRDVLDFTSFLDATANARGTSSGAPGAPVGANKVTERSVQYDFNDFTTTFGGGQSTTDNQGTFGYHNTVNKINLSQVWANLSTTAATRPTSFEAITEAQLKAAIEAILTTTGRDVALDGMKFTVMLVQDQEINRDTNGDPALGANIADPSKALILSGTTSVTSAGDQTFTFTKQGSIEFVGAFSSLDDIGEKNIAQTADAITAEKAIAKKIADATQPAEVSVAKIPATGDYSLKDAASTLATTATSAQLNGAYNITATDAATVSQAETIADATNSGSTSFNVEDTATAVITTAKQATATLKNGLAEAGTITLAANTAGDKEAVTFNNLEADLAATTIDFTDNAVTLTAAELNAIFGASGAALAATATDAITVNTLTGATVAATAATDTFVFAATDTNVAITGFTTGTDKVDLAFTTETATTAVVADADFTITNDKVYFISGAADDTDAAGSITAAIDTGTITDTANTAYVVIADTDSSSIYKWTGDAQGDGVTGDTLTLVGTVDAVLTTTDLVFA